MELTLPAVVEITIPSYAREQRTQIRVQIRIQGNVWKEMDVDLIKGNTFTVTGALIPLTVEAA